MNDQMLLIFPILIFIIFAAGAKIFHGGSINTEAWSVGQAKTMQVFAALMIILHHTVQIITNCTRIDKGLITRWNSFGILFTSIFFFFSGFGLFKGCKEKENYLNGFLFHRLSKVLIPFMITNIIYLITIGPTRITKLRHVFTSIFGFTLMNTNAWFIINIVILYIAFYIFFRHSRSENAAIIKLTVFTIIFVGISLLLGHDKSAVRGHWFMGEWWYNTTLIFILGIIVAKYEVQLKVFASKLYPAKLIFFAVLLTGSYFLSEYLTQHFGYYAEWEGHPGYKEKLISLLGQTLLCIVFILFLLLINIKVRFGNPVNRYLGKMSYEIYLIHDIFRRLLPAGPDGTMPDMEYIALTYLFSLICAWLLYMIDRFILRIIAAKHQKKSDAH